MVYLTIVLSLLPLLVGCGNGERERPVIPSIPRSALTNIERQLPVVVSERGHVTEDGRKIPLIGFDTTQTVRSNKDLLDLYKEIYKRLATAMKPSKETETWETRLFINKEAKVWVGLSNDGDTGMFAPRPAIALISMGPKGTLGLSFWNSDSQRLVREDETSLRELFAEELALDKEE